MIPRLDPRGFFPNLSLVIAENGLSTNLSIEPLGSKRKMWIMLKDEPDRPWLLKFARKNTGEHWAEKLGHECAKLLGLPSARVELAQVGVEPAMIVESIIPFQRSMPVDQLEGCGELIHGNEILAGRILGYNRERQWGQEDHSWNNIISALRQSLPPETFQGSMTQFAGMLVLDALIGNTDRHHENWALLQIHKPQPSLKLSPSYDHASALGRELTDDARKQIIADNAIEAYAKRGRGAIFATAHGRHGDNPLELVKWAVSVEPGWFKPWIDRLKVVTLEEITSIVDRLPPEAVSLTAKSFTKYFLSYTHQVLSEIIT